MNSIYREWFGWCLLLVAIVTPVVIWWLATGNPVVYFTGEVPPGQLSYVLSKLAGLLAFAALWIQAMLALARRARVLQFMPSANRRVHAFLGIATVVLVLMHLGLFFHGVTVRTGSPAFGLLVPNFDAGYYQANLSLGKLAVYGLMLVLWAGAMRARGRSGWSWLHRLWLPIFALAFWHAFSIGSESRFGGMQYWMMLMLTMVCAGLAWELPRWVKRRKLPSGLISGELRG